MQNREDIGKLVRRIWVQWAKEQDEVKASWLVGWEELGEGQKEVDMRIGEGIIRTFLNTLSNNVRVEILKETLLTKNLYLSTLTSSTIEHSGNTKPEFDSNGNLITSEAIGQDDNGDDIWVSYV